MCDKKNFLIRQEGDASPGHPTDYAGFTNKITWTVWSGMLEGGTLDYWLDFAVERGGQECLSLSFQVRQQFEELSYPGLSPMVLEFVTFAISEVDWEQIAGKLLEYLDDSTPPLYG